MAADPVHELIARYNREAAAYRELWAPILRMAGSRLIEQLPRSGIQRVLDLGSGTGGLVPDLWAAFPRARILCADRSPGMLSLASHGFPRAVMDAGQLAVPSQSVDLALLAFMLFHVPDPAAALREVRRVVCRGGLAACLTWARDLESTASRIWTECLDACGAAEPDTASLTPHDRFNSPEKIEKLFREAGFTSIRCWEEELATSIHQEHLLKLKTSMGSSKPRFDSLAPKLRERCVAEARRRMAALRPGDFLARGRTVQMVAVA